MANIFALTQTLHSWLDKAFWAFEFKGVHEETIDGTTVWQTIVKFHFLPACKTQAAASHRDIDIAIDRIAYQLSTQHAEGLPARGPEEGDGIIGAFLATGERLQSGHLFGISHDNQEDAELCGYLFMMQWVCMCLLTVSGIAVKEGML
ncbi:hypothetical protein NW752_005481 [Fusarium irregulare]|uniref:Uncharacterized protein n=1 Tax=Fusarium irregulare TaxID=2494466 RepID=A0A9W8UA56_9HYPO|nr:hypothetical protein NW766_006009 [Fusarium irregulare]KAJ4018366.1 hypothetical protein NW752_005481 [Fusarium irregulare]